jgi:hypothetical protein
MQRQPISQKQASHALAQVALGVFDAIEAAGKQGTPSGVLYAAMQSHGATLNQYQTFMRTLVNPGYLVLLDDCYRMTPEGAAFKATLTMRVSAAQSE